MSQKWIDIVLQASSADNYEAAKQEWEELKKEDRDSFDDGPPCACGRKIKHASFYVNRLTGRTLVAGTSCSGKFTNEVKRKADPMYKKAVLEVMEKGIFIEISEPEYTNSVREALIRHIRSEMCNDIGELELLKRKVSRITAQYEKIGNLDSVLKEINDKIKELEKRERERLQKLAEEREKELERLAKNREEEARLEKERREYNHRIMMEKLARPKPQPRPRPRPESPQLLPPLPPRQPPARVIAETREYVNPNLLKISKWFEGHEKPSITLMYT